MLSAFSNLTSPEQCLMIGSLVATLYYLAFLLLHPRWIRQRIQNCNWQNYQRKMLITRIGMIVIIVLTACTAVYLESRSWQKCAVILGMIICYILMRIRQKKQH